jgi:hypothetical protein
MEFTTQFKLQSQATRLYKSASCGREPPRHRILTFSDTLFQGILAAVAADGAFLDYNSGGREGRQIVGVSSALFIRHY